jgi:hypothetical protein
MFDQMAFENFKVLSESYLKRVKDEIDEELNGLMLMNLQSLNAGKIGPSQGQFYAHL